MLRIFYILLLLSLPLTSWAEPEVSPDELSRLAGKISDKVPEIRRGRRMAREANVRLATYGGTSRELIELAQEGIAKFGSVAKYEAWLDKQATIHLLDWHRIASDLDFMLLPEAGVDPKVLAGLKARIEAEFPGTVFYEKFDMNIQGEFFRQYPAGGEHFEATSNVPITERGVEFLPELDTEIDDGKKVNLAQWGLEQYSRNRFEFRLAKGFPKTRASDTYGNLRQVLRWIRYLSEHPNMKVSPEADAAIRSLLEHVLTHDRAGVLSLLKTGDEGLRGRKKASNNGEKIISALEKLQIYSKNSRKTRHLLEQYGIVALAREAGIDKTRILKPLVERDAGERARAGEGMPRLGREIVVYHRTSLTASQNISHGAVWMSDNETIIAGSTTAAIQGDGLYAAEGIRSLEYGDMYVKITLSADAIPGIDFTGSHWLALKYLDAIAKNEDGTYKIEKVTRNTLVQDQIAKLRSKALGEDQRPLISAAEKASAIRSLSTLLAPETHPRDATLFNETLKAAAEHGMETAFLKSYLEKRGVLSEILRANTHFARQFRDRILTFSQKPPWPGFELALVREALLDPETIFGHWPDLEQRLPALIDQVEGAHYSLADLVSDQVAMKAMRRHFPQAWQRLMERITHAGRLDLIAWDLRDSQEVAELQRLIKAYPHPAWPQGHQAIEETLQKIKQRDSDFTLHTNDWTALAADRQAETVVDGGLRAELKARLQAYRARLSLEKTIGALFTSHPHLVAQQFPVEGARGIDLQWSAIQFSEDGPPKIDPARLPGAGREAVEKLFQKISRRSRAALTAEDYALIHLLLRIPHAADVAGILLNGRSEVRNYAIQQLKQMGDQGFSQLQTVLSWEKGSQSHPAWRAMRENGFHMISQALREDAGWRHGYQDWALREGAHLSQVPWDLSDAGDTERLKRAASDATAKRQKLLEVVRRIKQTEGHSFDPQGLKPEKIGDPALQQQYHEALRNYELARTLLPPVLSALRDQQPQAFALHFPDQATPPLVLPNPWDDQKKWEDIVTRWNAQGFSKLLRAERRLLQFLGGQPIEDLPGPFWNYLINKGGVAGMKWLADRLLQGQDSDSPMGIMYLLRDGRERLAAQLRGNPNLPALKAKLRAYFLTGGIHELDFGIKDYPWDARDGEDLKLLQTLASQYPERKRKMLLSLSELERQIKQGDAAYKGGDWRYPSKDIEGDTLLDEGLRKRLLQERRDLRGRQHVGDVLSQLFSQEPTLIARHFGPILADSLEIRWHQFIVDETGQVTIKDGPIQGEAKRAVELLLKKVQRKSRAPITDEDYQLINFLLRVPHTSDLQSLFLAGRTEVRDHVIDRLRDAGEESFPILEDILSATKSRSPIDKVRNEAKRQLQEAFARDRGWKKSFQTHLISQGDKVHIIPWDLRDAEEVSLLRSGLSRREEKRQALIAVHREIKRAQGIDFNIFSNLGQVAPHEINDPGLRTRYERAQREFFLASLHGPALLTSLRTTEPQLLAETLPEYPEVVSFPEIFREQALWQDRVQRWEANGFRALEPEEKALLKRLAAQSLDEQKAVYFYSNLYKSGGPVVRQWVIDQVLTPGRHDPNYLLYLLNAAGPELVEPLARDSRYPAWKSRLRSYMESGGLAQSLTTSYPWDMDDPEDRSALQRLAQRYPSPARQTHEAPLQELYRQMQWEGKNYQFSGQDWNNSGSDGLAESIVNDSLREAVLQRRADFRARYRLEKIAADLFKTHPVAVAQNLGAVAAAGLELPNPGLKWDGDISVDQGKFGEKGAAALQDLFRKVNRKSRAPLTPSDYALIDLLLAGRANDELVSILLVGRAEVRDHVLATLKSDPDRAYHFARRALGYSPRGGDSVRATIEREARRILLAELKRDGVWRRTLQEIAVSGGNFLAVFPWEKQNREDMRILAEVIGGLKEKEEALIAIHRQLKQEQGIPFHPDHLGETSPEGIRQPALREAYCRARHAYLLAKTYGPAALQAAGLSAEQVRKAACDEDWSAI